MSSQEELKRGLNPRHIFFIALGSAIGTGLFYGSAKAIQVAGPAVLLAYIIAGAAVFMVMRALGEMVLVKPIPGAFGGYASHYIGPLAGFITGWTYIFEMALVCLADVTAFATYMAFWLPNVSPWIWTLGITLIITGLNLCAVKIFGELEFWLSLIKVLAIVGMILGGIALLFWGYTSSYTTETGQVVEQTASIKNLWQHGGFMPNGVWGVIQAFAVVMFAFGGIEIIGLTAAEAEDPEKNIPRAINTVPSRILLFYVGTLAVLMSLFPWNQIGLSGSPFVTIFQGLGIESAAHILNIVVITAAISAINSDIFGSARMMYGLAKHKQAPESFGKISAKGVPFAPVMAMFATLLVGVLLNVWFHEQLFFIIAAIATFATVWVWLMILLSHVNMRRKMTPEEVKNIKFPVPFWPYAPGAAIAFLVFVIAMLGVGDNWTALVAGAVWIAILTVCYYVFVKGKEIPLTQVIGDEVPSTPAEEDKKE